MRPRGRSILVIGSGGREHALAWRLGHSPLAARLLCAPGNPGTARLPGAANVPVGVLEIDRLREVVRREEIDLVVIGPEAPLQAGLAEAIAADRGERTAVFGCSAAAAEIEASKVFAKAFMNRHGIPTAAHTVVKSEMEAAAFLDRQAALGRPAWVVKADGLRAGKGVSVCEGPAQAQAAVRALLVDGGPAVIEERLAGREASCMALCDGEYVIALPPCEDHKTIGEGDTGPMTGGMGALCPTPVAPPSLMAEIRERVLVPAAHGMAREGRPFHGLLYAGIMRTAPTDDGPRVLEFNCRFGNPETQPLMMLFTDDLVTYLEAVGRHRLEALGPPRIAPGVAVCVVIAAPGYPGAPRTGDPITGVEAAEAVDPGQVVVFHAGTSLPEQGPSAGRLVTAGGRVLGVTARGATLEEARQTAYLAAAQIHFDGAYLRRDIGARS